MLDRARIILCFDDRFADAPEFLRLRAAFGDDAQSATNYPLVQIQNNKTHHKFFARTHGFSTMAMATGAVMTYTSFDILPTSAGTEFGDSTLVVIANGIPSKPVGIIVGQ